MKIEKTESGLYVPSAPTPVKKVKVTHDKLGLQVQPASYLADRGINHYGSYKDKYILIYVCMLEQKGSHLGFSMYGGEGRCFGHPPFFQPCLMTKEHAEERLEYYKENEFCEYT